MDWSLTSPRFLTANSVVGCAGMALVLVGAAVWTTDARAQVWPCSGTTVELAQSLRAPRPM